MKKTLLLFISILFVSCANLNLNKKEKFDVSFNWNENVSDVYLDKKHIKNGSEYEVEEGEYKVSWKYKEINTIDYETNSFTHFWIYKNINIDKSSNFNIISNQIKKED